MEMGGRNIDYLRLRPPLDRPEVRQASAHGGQERQARSTVVVAGHGRKARISWKTACHMQRPMARVNGEILPKATPRGQNRTGLWIIRVRSERSEHGACPNHQPNRYLPSFSI